MNEFEAFVAEKMKELIPEYDTIELKASVSSSSYSIEFFATVNGKRMQCFEMIDGGILSEKKFNAVSKDIANFCRKQVDFKENEINKYVVTL